MADDDITSGSADEQIAVAAADQDVIAASTFQSAIAAGVEPGRQGDRVVYRDIGAIATIGDNSAGRQEGAVRQIVQVDLDFAGIRAGHKLDAVASVVRII